ncbi:MAG: ATP-binding cassette domain-containing protein [bacterium]|nr:ATP-binding cassette domain-containing protein [bacterium]
MSNEKIKRIEVHSLSKIFQIGYKKKDSALAKALSFFSGIEDTREHCVLNDISFQAYSGEIVGIIGRNGSGKSTLLRIIAGIFQPTSGFIKTEGSMMYLSGFGTGLKPKLTMRENIFLLGSIMGLRREDIMHQFQKIVDFSGLNEYIDTKVFQFSSGMTTRLNFSIAIHCIEHHNPEILLLDEVLGGGGDIDFQKQAADKMQECMRSGATVLLVSHNLKEIEKYCHRVLWLKNGTIIQSGNVGEVITAYRENKHG